jgi:nicotinamidase-related amidase
VRDALLVIDVLTDFRHEGGDPLLESFREHQPAIVRLLDDARRRGMPVIYANDSHGSWEWDTGAWCRQMLERSRAGSLLEEVAPRDGDALVRKTRYSAFDHTPLEIILHDLEIERVLLAGAATEMCIVQTAIGARELGLKVTICADACASVDPRDAETALVYAERVVGARIDRDAGER